MDIEYVIVFFLIFLFFIGIILGAGWGAIAIEQKSCEAKARALNYNYEWGIWQGCVLEKPNGDKILLEKLRYNELD